MLIRRHRWLSHGRIAFVPKLVGTGQNSGVKGRFLGIIPCRPNCRHHLYWGDSLIGKPAESGKSAVLNLADQAWSSSPESGADFLALHGFLAGEADFLPPDEIAKAHD